MPQVNPSSHIPYGQASGLGSDDAGPCVKRSFVSKSLNKMKNLFRSDHAVSPNQKASAPKQTTSVDTGQCATAQGDTSTLSTRYLSGSSALAVLSDWDGSTYNTRTLMHLNGSNLQHGLVHEDASKMIAALKDSLADGGKVIWVGGVDSQSDYSLAMGLSQDAGGRQPLRDLLATPNVSTVIAGASGIDINADGTFALTEGGKARGVLSEHEVRQMLSHYG